MNQKTKALLVISLLALFGTACSFGRDSSSETAKLPNPMIKIEDSSQWEEELGIKIDTQYLPEEAELYLIDEQIAQVDFKMENVDGEEIDCTLRAAKTETDISGVYGDAEEIKQEYSCGDSTIEVTVKDYAANRVQVYQFFYEDVQYVFQYTGTMSMMQLGEILDGVFMAIGAEG